MSRRQYNRNWYKRNRESVRRRANLWHKRNRKKINVRRRLNRHKMTKEQYNYFVVKQKNRCAICRKIFRQTPHIDHCHKTGRNRGLLCSDCNKALGFFKDSIKSLQTAIEYLKDLR